MGGGAEKEREDAFMTTTTIYDKIRQRGAGTNISNKTPFARMLTRRKPPPQVLQPTENKPEINPKRYIRIGRVIHPETGAIGDETVLPLPSNPDMNEAIAVVGGTGTGKSVTVRRIVEHYALIERRCVIIIEPIKKTYWSLAYPQDNTKIDMLRDLLSNGETPTAIPEVEVYIPVYDIVPPLTWDIIKRDYHATKPFSIRTSGLTPPTFFELADKIPKGTNYQLILEEILNTLPEKSIQSIKDALYAKKEEDPTAARSIDALLTVFNPLCNMGIIRDDGTDIREMLHPPRQHTPGKVSVICLGIHQKDRRRDAVVASIVQQLLEAVRDSPSLEPVLVIDELIQFVPRKGGEHDVTRASIVDLHQLVRGWRLKRVFGYQRADDIDDAITDFQNTPIQINLTKSLELYNPETGSFRINDVGIGRVTVQGLGDKNVPDCSFLAKMYPCRTKHVDG